MFGVLEPKAKSEGWLVTCPHGIVYPEGSAPGAKVASDPKPTPPVAVHVIAPDDANPQSSLIETAVATDDPFPTQNFAGARLGSPPLPVHVMVKFGEVPLAVQPVARLSDPAPVSGVP